LHCIVSVSFTFILVVSFSLFFMISPFPQSTRVTQHSFSLLVRGEALPCLHYSLTSPQISDADLPLSPTLYIIIILFFCFFLHLVSSFRIAV
jgi:hypothetical protein